MDTSQQATAHETSEMLRPPPLMGLRKNSKVSSGPVVLSPDFSPVATESCLPGAISPVLSPTPRLPRIMFTHHSEKTRIMLAGRQSDPIELITLIVPENENQVQLVDDVKVVLAGNKPSFATELHFYKRSEFEKTSSGTPSSSPLTSPSGSPNKKFVLQGAKLDFLPSAVDTVGKAWSVWLEANLGSLGGDSPTFGFINEMFRLFSHPDSEFRFITATGACLEAVEAWVKATFPDKKVFYGSPSTSMSRELGSGRKGNTDVSKAIARELIAGFGASSAPLLVAPAPAPIDTTKPFFTKVNHFSTATTASPSAIDLQISHRAPHVCDASAPIKGVLVIKDETPALAMPLFAAPAASRDPSLTAVLSLKGEAAPVSSQANTRAGAEVVNTVLQSGQVQNVNPGSTPFCGMLCWKRPVDKGVVYQAPIK